MSTTRLFFALWPDDRQRDRLRNAIAPVARQIEGSTVHRGLWHVTTGFVGEFEQRRMPALVEAASAVKREPIRLRFDRVEFWPAPRVAVLAAQTVPAALARLVDALKVVLVDAGIAVDTRLYRPHITIARRVRPFPVERLAQPVTIEWADFELIESVPARGGRSYRPVSG